MSCHQDCQVDVVYICHHPPRLSTPGSVQTPLACKRWAGPWADPYFLFRLCFLDSSCVEVLVSFLHPDGLREGPEGWGLEI